VPHSGCRLAGSPTQVADAELDDGVLAVLGFDDGKPIATSSPEARANASASATSAGVRQRTIAAGQTLRERTIAGVRTRS
jgi:hypothetical protein